MQQIKLHNDVKTRTVASFVNTNGDWGLRDVERFLPAHIVEFVSGLSILVMVMIHTLAWNLTSDYSFSFAYSYDKLTDCCYQISYVWDGRVCLEYNVFFGKQAMRAY